MRLATHLVLLSALVMLLPEQLQADAYDWQLKRDKKAVQIYTRKVEGSAFKAVKGVTELESSLAALVALVRDTEACPKWADRCARSYIHETINPTEDLVYTRNALPWPVSDRDVLARVTWQQDPNDLSVSMLSVATEDILPRNKGVVRLKDASAKWTFIPLEDGKVRVETEAHIDPAGPLPAWVTNMLLVDAPHKTLVNLRELAVQEPYKSQSLSYIKEATVD